MARVGGSCSGVRAIARGDRPSIVTAMSPRISVDEVVHVAKLARLELASDEVERFAAQLAKILDHAADIEALDLDGVDPPDTRFRSPT